MSDGFTLPLDTSRRYHAILQKVSDRVKTRIYAVYADSRKDPVGCAYTTPLPGHRTALLSGAAILPGFRNRGLYRALLNRRLNDAIDDAIHTVVVVANSETSAPICRAFGFAKACDMVYFTHQAG